jgi:hypothetical protein
LAAQTNIQAGQQCDRLKNNIINNALTIDCAIDERKTPVNEPLVTDSAIDKRVTSVNEPLVIDE